MSTPHITVPNNTWVSTNTLSDNDILNYGQDIFESPKLVVHLTDDSVRLYSEQQLMQMFRLGYNTKELGPYKLLSKMAVGDTAVFPYECWGSLRNAASTLKKKYYRTFSVKKQGLWGERGTIRVTRNS